MSLIELIFGDGRPKTKYSGLKEDELIQKYRYDTFSGLGENEKLALYQETVNRRAAADLGKGFCPVVKFADMDESEAGYQIGNNIFINRNLYGKNPDGPESEFNNMQALETVLHEYRHYWQGLMASGLVPCDEETKRCLRANFGGDVRYIDGNRASPYLSGKSGSWTGYSIYYCQPSETDAHRWSETETLKVMNHIREAPDSGIDTASKKRNETSYQKYEEYIETRGHSAQIEEARENLGVNNPEEQIATVLTNAYYGENKQVDADLEKIVHKEMIATQRAKEEKLSESTAAKHSGTGLTDAEKMDAAERSYTSEVSVCSHSTENNAEKRLETAESQNASHNNSYVHG